MIKQEHVSIIITNHQHPLSFPLHTLRTVSLSLLGTYVKVLRNFVTLDTGTTTLQLPAGEVS